MRSSIDQANLFNEYFYSQFSDASTYDVNIDIGRNENCFMDLRFHAVDMSSI